MDDILVLKWCTLLWKSDNYTISFKDIIPFKNYLNSKYELYFIFYLKSVLYPDNIFLIALGYKKSKSVINPYNSFLS